MPQIAHTEPDKARELGDCKPDTAFDEGGDSLDLFINKNLEIVKTLTFHRMKPSTMNWIYDPRP